MIYEHHNLLSWFFPFEHLSHGHFAVGILSILFYILLFVTAEFLMRNVQGKAVRGLIVAIVASFLAFVSVAYAMCPMGFVPPGRIYHPDDNTRGLLVFASGQEKLILEPSFTGNAKDFGLVLPVPSRPELKEAPADLFKELQDLTNPIVPGKGMRMFEAAPQASSDVTIIEQKDVGDYTATTLTAESANALIAWLDTNGYHYNPSDRENLDYYVRKGGFYFVALKVNMQKAKVDEKGFLSGRLRPIEFSFTAAAPMLPLRSMASDMEPMNFTLYTLSDSAYYIPGAEILYSKQVSGEDLAKVPTLKEYAALDKWLVRNNVRFDPKQIGEDLRLLNGGRKLEIAVGAKRRVNPHLTPGQSGIIESQTATVAYVGGIDLAPTAEAFSRNLMRSSRGNDVKLLQIMLRDAGVYPEGLITGYFGPLTHKAVIRYQDMRKHQILAPIELSSGTGYVGAMTRKVLNETSAL